MLRGVASLSPPLAGASEPGYYLTLVELGELMKAGAERLKKEE
jgi:hypothetical protein